MMVAWGNMSGALPGARKPRRFAMTVIVPMLTRMLARPLVTGVAMAGSTSPRVATAGLEVINRAIEALPRAHPSIRRKRIGGLDCDVVNPKGTGGTLIYYHGGGLVLLDPITHRQVIMALARRLDVKVIAPVYPKLHRSSVDEILDECESVMDEVTATTADRVYLAGDSAGGFIALHMAARAASGTGYPISGVVTFSPMVTTDPAERVASGVSDALFSATALQIVQTVATYRGSSPELMEVQWSRADQDRLPPILVIYSGDEVFQWDANRAGRMWPDSVRLVEYPGEVHAFPAIHPFAGGGACAVLRASQFLRGSCLNATLPAEDDDATAELVIGGGHIGG